MGTKSIDSNIMSCGARRFEVFSENENERIYKSALEILERTGVNIKNPEAVELLKNAGCYVDGTIVRIPSTVVEKALANAPKRVVLCDRNKNRKILLEGHNSYFGPGPSCVNFIDSKTKERHPAKKSDIINVARLTDYLEDLDFVMGLGVIADQEPVLADVHEFHGLVQNTTKPIIAWAFGVDNLKYVIDMAVEVAGGMDELRQNPFMAVYSMPVTPLTHPEDSLAKLLYTAELGLPQIYSPGALFGATAPITIAGTLAVGIADTLTGLIIAQLKNPGTPFICASLAGGLDFKTMQGMYASNESNLQAMASASVLRYLGIPIWSVAGCTDSKCIDAQAAVDATLEIYSVALAGGQLVHDLGLTDGGLTASLEMLYLCAEVVGRVRRLMNGIAVNAHTIPMELIDEVGPGGDYLSTDHTLDNYQDELTFSEVYENRAYEPWEADGKKTLEDRITARVLKILDEHKPEQLPAETVKKLDAILAAAIAEG